MFFSFNVSQIKIEPVKNLNLYKSKLSTTESVTISVCFKGKKDADINVQVSSIVEDNDEPK